MSGETAPMHDETGSDVSEQKDPTLWLVETEGPVRPFFDSENLPPVEALDLGYLASLRGKVNYNTPGVADPLNIKEATRFIAEASDGSMEDEQFEDIYGRVAGVLLKSIADKNKLENQDKAEDKDKLEDAFDLLESGHSRILDILGRVRKECPISSHQATTLNKMCLLFEYIRITET